MNKTLFAKKKKIKSVCLNKNGIIMAISADIGKYNIPKKKEK
jgi:hypothetical protein